MRRRYYGDNNGNSKRSLSNMVTTFQEAGNRIFKLLDKYIEMKRLDEAEDHQIVQNIFQPISALIEQNKIENSNGEKIMT
jgi:hypothetical protein